MTFYQEYIDELKQKPFIKALMLKGFVHIVGGLVRDLFLGKESKDLDLLITKIPVDQLIITLKEFGNVDLVGKSFGIIKFFEHGSKEAIDIALPRTERSSGPGHKDFNVVSDPFLPIEADLKRRDFRINSIAICLNTGELIDPFDGQFDLKNKIIRVLTETSFKEDPLRILRGIGFCSRFDMSFDNDTLRSILLERSKIKTIAGERVLEELKKIFDKGDIETGLLLFISSTLLYKEFFEKNFTKFEYIHKIETWFDFITVLLMDLDNPVEFYKERLHGDIVTSKQIKAVLFGLKNEKEDEYSNRWIAYQIHQIHPEAIKSGLFNDKMKEAISYIEYKEYPWNLKELDVNGDLLLKLGYKPIDIGKILNMVVKAIIEEKVPNDKFPILKYIEENPV